MTFSQSIVSFVDILGYSAMVESDSLRDDPIYLEKVTKIIRQVVCSGDNAFDVRQFSDSIILSCRYDAGNAIKMLKLLRTAQKLSIGEGILLRGAVAFGRHFSSSSVVFSQGVITAYRLESRAARHPRIIIDPNLYFLVNGTIYGDQGINQDFNKLLVCDRDQYDFVHYLDKEFLPIHETSIRALCRQAPLSDPSVLEKFDCLEKYYNFVASSIGLEEIVLGLPQLVACKSSI